MRGALKRAMPGAPAKQTATLHISLLRMAGGAAALAAAAARDKVQVSEQRSVDDSCGLSPTQST